MQLLQNSFIFKKKKKKAIAAVSEKLLWVLLVMLFNNYPHVCCLSQAGGVGCVMWTIAAGRGGRHSQVFVTSAALYECHWNTPWQFLAGSFVCRWAPRCSWRLKLIVSGWSCRGGGCPWGQLRGMGRANSRSWGKESRCLIALFLIL